MAEHTLEVVQVPVFEVLNTDLVISVKADEEQFGKLTVSRGGVGWYPRGGELERHFTWEQFARMVREARDN
jgi:hypothetical protein